MTRSSAATRVLPQPHTVGALMLGAALALAPLASKAQDSQPAPAPAESGQAAPVQHASPAANTAEGQAAESGTAAPAAGGDTGAPSAEAATGGPAPSAEAAAGASGAAAAGGGAEGQLRQAGGTFRSAEGADLGTVVLTETASGLMHVILDISEGALPAAQHGLHIHENGLCEGPSFESAGGHLAGDKEHGVHSANGPHPGDLPNITMGASGALHVEYFLPGVLMDQILDENGSAVMIHSDVDDYTSQPGGNSGDRIGCAVLELTS